MEISDKYKHAILVLQAIAQTDGEGNGYFDEWTQAKAWIDCRKAAFNALEYLGEDTVMQNKREKENREGTRREIADKDMNERR